MTDQLRLLLAVLLIAAGVLGFLMAFSLLWDSRQNQSEIHVHVPMTYKMLGRVQADTLCVHPDTAMFANGTHRPVPQVLAGVADETLARNEIFILKQQ